VEGMSIWCKVLTTVYLLCEDSLGLLKGGRCN